MRSPALRRPGASYCYKYRRCRQPKSPRRPALMREQYLRRPFPMLAPQTGPITCPEKEKQRHVAIVVASSYEMHTIIWCLIGRGSASSCPVRAVAQELNFFKTTLAAAYF